MLRFDHMSEGTPGADMDSLAQFKQDFKSAAAEQHRGQIPGYGGFVRGANCADGFTFGKMSRMDASANLRAVANQLPSEPNRLNSPARRTRRPGSKGKALTTSRSISGYTGFSPGQKDRIGPTVNRGFQNQPSPTSMQRSGLSQSRTQIMFGRTANSIVSNGLMGTPSNRGPISFNRGGKNYFDPAPASKTELRGSKIPGYSGYVTGKGADSTFGVGSTFGKVTNSDAKAEYLSKGDDWRSSYVSATQLQQQQGASVWKR